MGDWRDPLNVTLEENYSVIVVPGEESSVDGVMSIETRHRLAKGMGCATCFTPLPGWPCAQNLKLYSSVDWNLPHRTSYEILDLILDRRCVVCGSEVTPEFFQVMMEFGGEV